MYIIYSFSFKSKVSFIGNPTNLHAFAVCTLNTQVFGQIRFLEEQRGITRQDTMDQQMIPFI